MKRILLFAAAMAVALSSCSKNEVADRPESAKRAVGFGSYAGVAAKATVESGFMGGDQLLVDAYFTEQTDYISLSSVPEAFMQDQRVTASGETDVAATAWTYSPIKYWPNDTGDKVSFFAVTDASATLPVTTFNTISDESLAPSFDVTDAATDIMIASCLDVEEPADGSITFAFKHIMSQVNVTAKLAAQLDAATTVTVTGFTIDGNDYPSNGTFTFDKEDESSGVWSSGGAASYFNDVATSYLLASLVDDGVLNNDDTPTATTLTEPILVVPSTSKTLAAELTYTVFTKAGENSPNNSTITNTATFNIEPTAMNTIYNYNISISLTGVVVKASISGWESTTVDKTVTVETTEATVD